MPKIVGFDTETYLTKQNQHLTHSFFSAQFFTKETTKKGKPIFKHDGFYTNPDEVIQLFKRKLWGKILLANNAEFDFTVLCKIMKGSGLTTRDLYNKSRFLWGQIGILSKENPNKFEHSWKIYDLMNIFSMWSLAKIGKFLGI